MQSQLYYIALNVQDQYLYAIYKENKKLFWKEEVTEALSSIPGSYKVNARKRLLTNKSHRFGGMVSETTKLQVVKDLPLFNPNRIEEIIVDGKVSQLALNLSYKLEEDFQVRVFPMLVSGSQLEIVPRTPKTRFAMLLSKEDGDTYLLFEGSPSAYLNQKMRIENERNSFFKKGYKPFKVVKI